ncbi:MAG: nodulation protein NodN [Rhodospirillaceae bacterium]|nr:nodulation protein NodN [Rhodospirillaceae bacterium]|tara:strand:- start:6411 stop:6863 length:453 start_codon:yes stop_codon:yes gene_type:complete
MSSETSIILERLHRPDTELGVSGWLLVDATLNQAFADATLDPVAIEIEGQAHAHGFLTMSLLSHLCSQALGLVTPGDMTEEGYTLNYGFNRLRLIEPVPLGSRIRGHFRTSTDGPTERGEVTLLPLDVRIEIEDNERPAMAAQWLLAWRP